MTTWHQEKARNWKNEYWQESLSNLSMMVTGGLLDLHDGHDRVQVINIIGLQI
jgi:hypothetical protein